MRDFFSYFQKFSRSNVQLLSGSIILTILLLLAIFVPMFSTHTYYDTHLSLKNSPPSSLFWFGTDELGRSVFSRVMYGARLSLFIGCVAAFIDMCIGVIYGVIAGYVGGRLESVMMGFIDIFHSLPRLIIVILLMIIMGQGLFTIIAAIAITGWINMARIVRAKVHVLKNEQFVISSQLLGASPLRIITTHLVPNVFGIVMSTLLLSIPASIFSEAYLSFLGLGVPAPEASWGTMASDGLSAFRYYPWRLFFPSFFISITLLSFHLIGEGMQHILDPRNHVRNR